MISEKHRCIFVHIPKTAGQSIEQFFLDLLGLSWKQRAPLLLKYNPEPRLGPEWLAHLTAREYIDCGHVSATDFTSYFTFSFVRNPWARMVSEYQYRGYSKKYSFDEFVLAGLPTKDRYSDVYRHMMPQSEFILDEKGEPLVDFIGRFENLQQDFDMVCEKLSIKRSSLPFRNSSSRKSGITARIRRIFAGKTDTQKAHYSSFYNKELREAVASLYASDIEAFNYEFEQR